MLSEIDHIQVPGFELVDELGRGADTVVYRARRGERDVAIKLLRRPADDHATETVRRFRREAGVLARVRHPATAKVLEAGEACGRPYIVTEYLAGGTLASALATRSLAEAEILALARTIGEVLAEIHRLGLVHRDIKPANILIGADGLPRLLDFGLAARAVAPEAGAAGGIAGSARYSPPEQTGMLKRPVDGRSDLYALGSVLFECITGRPPFLGDDPAELIRLHAVALPPELRRLNSHVSPAFAAIVAKLLAKDPDDRYQSAVGLLADLERLPQLNQRLGTGQTVTLDALAGQPAVLDQTLVVGREAELAQLQAAWAEAQAGQGLAVLVTGEPGCGKTRLVRELLRRLERGPLVLTGKCSDADATPLAPFRQAIESYLLGLERLAEPDRRAAHQQLSTAAGGLAPLVQRLSPSLARVLGEAPDLPETEGGQDRFHGAIAELFCRLAQARPTVLFLDDLHWIDANSRGVLQLLAARASAASLLIVGTARPDETAGQVVDRLLDDLGLARPRRIALGPLPAEAVTSLVIDYLGGRPVDPDFVQRIVDRSRGNPLAAGEYVRALLAAGQLRPYWGTWVLEAQGLDQLDLPEDVIGLVVQRIALLGDATRAILAAAAVIGVRIQPDRLAEVTAAPFETVQAAVEEALHGQLLESEAGGGYRFVHDRVREALLRSLPLAEQQRLHQRVATAIEAAGPAAPDEIYALAQHYASGEAEQHADRVYETSFAAARLASASYADQQALEFLATAQRAAEQSGRAPEAAFEQLLGEVCNRTGRIEDAAGHLERALALAKDPATRVGLYTELIEIQVTTQNTRRGWALIEAALREAGEPPLRASPGGLLRLGWHWLRFTLGERFRPVSSRARDPRHKLRSTLTRLYWSAAEAAFIDDRSPIVQLGCTLRSLCLARQIGPSPELAIAYALYGTVLALAGRRGGCRRYLDRACRLAELLGDRPTLARVWTLEGVATHFLGDARHAEQLHRRTIEQAERWLSAQDYRDSAGDLIVNLKLRGYAREITSLAERADARIFAGNERGTWAGLGWFLGVHNGPALAMLGQPAAGLGYLKRARALVERAPEDRASWNNYLANELFFQLEQGETGPAVDATIAASERLDVRPDQPVGQLTYYLVPVAYLRLAQLLSATAADRPARRRQLQAALGRLKRAALRPASRCHYLVIAGAVARLAGRLARAEQLLATAETVANEVDSPWALYEAARQRAHLFLERENRPAALRQAAAALDIATRQSWVNRARWIAAEFPVEPAAGMPAADRSLPQPASRDGLRLQRQLDALLEVSLSAASRRDPKEQARVALDELIRILGAERGVVLFCEAGAELTFGAGRDATGNDLTELAGYSRTVVESVRTTCQPLIISSTEQGRVAAAQSIVAHDLRSIIAAPLLLRDKLVGVIYLDNRLARGVFGEDDLAILRAVATHVAIALETARAFTAQAALTDEVTRLLRVVESQVEALQRSSQQLTAAEERQRREIAEFLHARVQGKLLIAWHRLGEVAAIVPTDAERAIGLLEAIRADLDALREQDVRQASHLLHPSYIRMGLLPALRSLANWLEPQLPVTVDAGPAVVALDDLVANRLPEPLRLVAYRVVEEALNNVIRHASATRAAVALRLAGPGLLEVAVRDDGSGFDPAGLMPGLGLYSVAGRVEQLQGTWEIQSAPGEGTTLTVKLPFEMAEK